MNVTIKSLEQQEKMRIAGKLASTVLDMIGEHVRAGITTDELDLICHKYITEVQDAIPAPLNYRGFPKSICTSINHVVCHGIPGPKKLKKGDAVMSHENYLTAMIQDQFFLSQGFKGPAFYDYLTPYLGELKKNHGHDPFYFESYYHPEVQYLTGCNMGRAGMPIVEKILFEDGRVKANLHCRTEHAEIYYSTDGSLPTKSSHQFTDIIDVPNGVTIRAIAIRDDIEVSPVIVFDQNMKWIDK